MPNIMDYDSAAAWQAAWNAWNEAQRAEREAQIRAARSNAAKRGAATRRRKGDTVRIMWDYAWTAREALYGYRYFILQDGQFLRQRPDCRTGFVWYDEAERFVRQREHA